MMPTATLQEFQRRLKAAGYDADIDELGAGPVRDGEQYAYVMDDGSIRFKPENRELASRVCGIYGEVSEYMAAFLAAAPGAARFPQGAEDTRTLIAYGGYELAARRLSNDSMDFVTWRLDRNGERETGHYFDGYAEAKEDFALRAGLIDRDK
ncbi:MAG: hypothetical protein LBD92_04030, partial [Oscillospiraceae bacterium]|nr:hypothetical protein [Oscillospiraceae bacterium]